tara:strand:+ start:128 stop:1933 length:1806 start_codon:yes stop_codon:yes gene_type:complete
MASNDFRRVLRLGRYLQRDKKRLLIILVILLPVALAGAMQPLLVGQAISVLRDEGTLPFIEQFSSVSAIRLIIACLLVSVLIRLALQGYQSYNIQSVGQRLTARIREDLFAHCMKLSLRFHDNMPVGKLLTRLTSDVDALAEVFGSGAVGILADFVSLFVISITMLLIEWRLGFVLIAIQVPATLLILWLQKRYRKSNYNVREELSQLNADFQENLQGLDVVQMFRREITNSNNFNKTGQIYRQAVNGTIFYDSAISAFIEWFSLAAIALVLAVGGLFVTDGFMGLGKLTTFVIYSQRLFEPLRQLAERFTQIQGGLTAIERIGELLEEPIEIIDKSPSGYFKNNSFITNYKPTSGEGEVVFDKVHFSYRGDETILDGLSFNISPGENVALVGPTGSGKTTIIRLLCRLYEPQKGNIYIDGVNVQDLPVHYLRQKLGVVLQDTFLFSGNVADNLRLDIPIDEDSLMDICKELGLKSLINSLPGGLNAELRERGSNLSSGEKQLLSVARVAIRNPAVLVMDEATAFMDPSTEATLQRDLDRILKNRTALVIAHRLATVENSDRILVLRKGQLVEEGTHNELRNTAGLYAQLADLQERGLNEF